MMYALSKRVAADLFEGEYIIANLDTGLYYSLQGFGIFLLDSLPLRSPSDAVDRAILEFKGMESEILNDLNSLWDQLLEEKIIVPAEGVIESSVVEVPKVFEKSVFNRYADMQDLLALDPIHEVDEEGWEKKQKDES
jgi:hypothetical protein